MKTKELYISYCWEDNIDGWLNMFSESLSDVVNIIIDKDKMKNGTSDISRFINDNMNRADYIAIMITPEYKRRADLEYNEKERSWVEVENDYIIKRCQKMKKTLIPIIVFKDQGKICMPNNIESLSYYDLSSPEKYDSEISRIKQVLKGDCSSEKVQNFYQNQLANSVIEHRGIDLQVNCTGIVPRLSSVVNVLTNVIYLNHAETVRLFLSRYSNRSWVDKSENIFFNEKLYIPINEYDKKKLIDVIDSEIDKYINLVQKYEAIYEVDLYDKINDSYKYNLIKVEKHFWEKLINFANNHDWDKGKSKWNIFQMNQNIIHVFSPAISYNPDYNSGEHAIFHAYKDDNLLNDDVIIYVDINDMVEYHGDSKINKKDRWGVRTAAKWLTDEMISFVCEKYKLEKDDVVKRSYNQKTEEIFSEMQMFYMCGKAKVMKEEVKSLIKSLAYCLEKEYPTEDYDYIFSKLGINPLNQNGNSQSIAQDIVKFINDSKFEKRISNDNNNSLADDLLRCIMVFTDSYSRSKISSYDYAYIISLNKSLIDKMKKVNLLTKYCF